jgi:hypothetical protein
LIINKYKVKAGNDNKPHSDIVNSVGGEGVMVLNAIFNISVISWRSVLLVEEIRELGEITDLLQVSH